MVLPAAGVVVPSELDAIVNVNSETVQPVGIALTPDVLVRLSGQTKVPVEAIPLTQLVVNSALVALSVQAVKLTSI